MSGAQAETPTTLTWLTGKFTSTAEGIGLKEPVLSIGINGDFRAYPLRILLWHEIVNDTVGGVPILVSYCPLCNSGVIFDRRVDGEVLRFGNTGRIRHFDMVMYDHNPESRWQQFLGEAIVGDMTGTRMKALPARLESLKNFIARAPMASYWCRTTSARGPTDRRLMFRWIALGCPGRVSAIRYRRTSSRWRGSWSSARRPGRWI